MRCSSQRYLASARKSKKTLDSHLSLRKPKLQGLDPLHVLIMDVTYSDGPRFVDGINIDLDANASVSTLIIEQEISNPVTGIDGVGYEPGQKNLDESDL